METKATNTSTAKRVSTRKPSTQNVEPSTRKPLLKQGTTWAGIFSIAAAIATGGASVLTDPAFFTSIGAGVALIFAEN